MPTDEIVYWVAYFDLKSAKMKREAEKSEQKAKNSSVQSKRYR